MKVTMTVDANDIGGRVDETDGNKTLLESLEMIQKGIWQAYLKQDDLARRVMEYVHVRVYFGSGRTYPFGIAAEFAIKLSGLADGMKWERETKGCLDNRKPVPDWYDHEWSADGISSFVCSKLSVLIDTQQSSYRAAAKSLNLKIVTA